MAFAKHAAIKRRTHFCCYAQIVGFEDKHLETAKPFPFQKQNFYPITETKKNILVEGTAVIQIIIKQ